MVPTYFSQCRSTSPRPFN